MQYRSRIQSGHSAAVLLKQTAPAWHPSHSPAKHYSLHSETSLWNMEPNLTKVSPALQLQATDGAPYACAGHQPLQGA